MLMTGETLEYRRARDQALCDRRDNHFSCDRRDCSELRLCGGAVAQPRRVCKGLYIPVGVDIPVRVVADENLRWGVRA